jgi:exodeoxyribonuclease V alpha subunit
MEEHTGTITDITFRNEDSGFSVLKLRKSDSTADIVCVGVMATLEKGESVKVTGTWESHSRFGKQFKVSGYELVRPTTIEGIKMLLGSGLIPNIGPARADKIIAAFGMQTLDILDNQPQRLREVAGIGKKIHTSIVSAWAQKRSIRDLVLFLQNFGVSLNLINKIYKTYGEKAKEVISANPYVMVDDIWGVGFIKADAIAQKFGFKADSYRRIKAGITHVLLESVDEGHLFLPQDELLKRAETILGVPGELILFSLDHVVQEKKVIQEQTRLYLPAYYNAEIDVAQMLANRCNERDQSGLAIQADYIDQWLQAYIKRCGWEADAKQLSAVKTAIQRKTMLLTGGPGTGKTTTLQVLVAFYREHNAQIMLAAPTGRAAQRMGSIAGCMAKTIHRLLEFHPGKEGFVFARNAANPLDAEVLIIDEVSMIDLMLLRHLLHAIPPKTTLILVGDNNQLPSVGAGSVLADCIASEVIAHVHLTTIFRQARLSRIVTAAHEILQDHVPIFSNGHAENCFFIKRDDPAECVETIIDLVVNRLPTRYGLNAVRDIQLLSPMHRGPLGTQELNRILQQALNHSTKKIIRGETVFALGDKVMQIQNSYEKSVFNGDIGSIVDIIDDFGMAVDFDGRVVMYESRELDGLMHAYCITIHKSQGCEFKTVIIPLVTHHHVMLQRNLLYTALTRARELCIIVGMPRALQRAVHNDLSQHRNSRLAERIVELSHSVQRSI